MKTWVMSLSVLLVVGIASPTWAQSQGEGIVSVPDPEAAVVPPEMRSAGISVLGSPVTSTNRRLTGVSDGTQAEISLAASGSSIVVTFNGGPNGSGFATSTDGGKTFQAMTSPPTPVGSAPCCDPSIVADSIGRFYFLQIFFDDGSATHNCTDSLHLSTDGGATFGSIIGSPFSYASGTTDFPDQPHMGIDRVNLVGGQPQLYTTTRHFTSGINCPQTGGSGTLQGEIVCSINGGTAWSAPFVFPTFTDTMHIGVAPNGRIYVVGYGTGTMANTAALLLWRSTTTGCTAPAALNFTGPTIVADNLTFSSAGMSREFAQPVVVVDQLDSDRVYVAWSSDRLTNVADRDVFLAGCDFIGGVGMCDAPVRVNDNPIGDGTAQVYPMLCIDPNNQILMSWNDRRLGGGPAPGGMVQIFHAEASTPSLGVSPNFLVSEVAFTPINNGGFPFYGDYNENNQACDANHLYVAWSSQVSPPEITPASTDVDVFFAVVNNLAEAQVQGPLDFGSVATNPVGGEAGFKDLEFEVINSGDASLTVNSVSCTAGNCADFTVLPNPSTPVIVSPGAQVSFVVRFDPTAAGARSANIQVSTNAFDNAILDLTATGNGATPSIRVTGSSAFGDVCGGAPQATQNLRVCNTGVSNLNVTSASIDCSDFTIVNNPFPAIVSPDSCLEPTISFTPTSGGLKSCTLTIASNDPSAPSTMLILTGNTPSVAVDVPPASTFPATVIQSVGACSSQEPFPVSNNGVCPLTISNVAISGTNGPDYSLAGLPSLPTSLQSGHILGEGNLDVVFQPTLVPLSRHETGTVTVTYEDDPITHHQTSVSQNLCGEDVTRGARVLVTAGGVPLPTVDRIHLTRLGSNRRGISVDNAVKVPLQAVNQTAPCASFNYHREWGGASNPIQLTAGDYQVTVDVTVPGTKKKASKTVSFALDTCSFNQNIVVDFP